jgi:cobalt-zinc-cadmium efflux system protein
VHVFTDVMAIGLSLFAVTVSARSHSGAMTFGYHRAEVLAAFANGLLLAVISMWRLYEAFSRVMSPQAIDAPLMLIAASIGIVGNLSNAPPKMPCKQEHQYPQCVHSCCL